MGYPTTVDANQVQPWSLDCTEINGSAAGTLTANTTYLVAKEVYATCTITSMKYRATTASGNLDLGIYDPASGNLLGHTGATAVVGGNPQTVNLLSNVMLNPGRYYLALWIDNATATIFNITSNNEFIGNIAQSASTNTTSLASTISGFGGVAGANEANTRVMISAVVSGGLP